MATFYWVGQSENGIGTQSGTSLPVPTTLQEIRKYHFNNPANWRVYYAPVHVFTPAKNTNSNTPYFTVGVTGAKGAVFAEANKINLTDFAINYQVYVKPDRAPGPYDNVVIGQLPWEKYNDVLIQDYIKIEPVFDGKFYKKDLWNGIPSNQQNTVPVLWNGYTGANYFYFDGTPTEMYSVKIPPATYIYGITGHSIVYNPELVNILKLATAQLNNSAQIVGAGLTAYAGFAIGGTIPEYAQFGGNPYSGMTAMGDSFVKINSPCLFGGVTVKDANQGTVIGATAETSTWWLNGGSGGTGWGVGTTSEGYLNEVYLVNPSIYSPYCAGEGQSSYPTVGSGMKNQMGTGLTAYTKLVDVLDNISYGVTGATTGTVDALTGNSIYNWSGLRLKARNVMSFSPLAYNKYPHPNYEDRKVVDRGWVPTLSGPSTQRSAAPFSAFEKELKLMPSLIGGTGAYKAYPKSKLYVNDLNGTFTLAEGYVQTQLGTPIDTTTPYTYTQKQRYDALVTVMGLTAATEYTTTLPNMQYAQHGNWNEFVNPHIGNSLQIFVGKGLTSVAAPIIIGDPLVSGTTAAAETRALGTTINSTSTTIFPEATVVGGLQVYAGLGDVVELSNQWKTLGAAGFGATADSRGLTNTNSVVRVTNSYLVGAAGLYGNTKGNVFFGSSKTGNNIYVERVLSNPLTITGQAEIESTSNLVLWGNVFVNQIDISNTNLLSFDSSLDNDTSVTYDMKNGQRLADYVVQGEDTIVDLSRDNQGSCVFGRYFGATGATASGILVGGVIASSDKANTILPSKGQQMWISGSINSILGDDRSSGNTNYNQAYTTVADLTTTGTALPATINGSNGSVITTGANLIALNNTQNTSLISSRQVVSDSISSPATTGSNFE